MNQQRLLFDYSPAFILLCLGVGIGYAWMLYTAKYTWTKRVNQFLFVIRALMVSLLAFLLIGPIIKLTHNIIEKPSLAFLIDNSLSIKETTDSLALQKIKQETDRIKKSLEETGYDVSVRNLADDETGAPDFRNPTSDLSGALRSITSDYEGKNLAGVVMFTDGIYNSGTSPLYSPARTPIYPVGLGDTTQRMDLALKNVAFNKIAYQGNQFPLRAEVLVQGLANQDVTVFIDQGGKQVTQTKNSANSLLLNFDFKLDATQKGLQRIDVAIEPNEKESNRKNNRASVFIEVVEGRKKILVIAPAPHPDIKVMRSVVEKNSNYEFILHMPGIKEADAAILQPGKADLIIFHQVADLQGKTNQLFSRLSKGSPLMVIVGTGSNLHQLQAMGVPLTFENLGQWDEVTPVINPGFGAFGLSDNSNAVFSRYPPVSVPFGKFTYPANANVFLDQRIGSVTTDRPLVMTVDENNHKMGILIGEGIWRWRLNEFSENERTEMFDEAFSKLIQYLSSQEDKRKFRCFPIQNEFSDAEPVIFESQIYNDLFEQVYGNKVEIEVRDEKGKLTSYNYITSAGSTRYRIGGLKEGVYKYTSATQIAGKREEVRGEFLVIEQNIEAQNLTADFDLLRKLANNTGGKFYQVSELTKLDYDLQSKKATGLIHTEDAFNPLINLKWVFFILLLMISGEWFLRKYLGSY